MLPLLIFLTTLIVHRVLSCTGDLLVYNSDDLRDTIENCMRLEGNIIVQESFSDILDLDGLSSVSGAIWVEKISHMPGLRSRTLERVNGSITVLNSTIETIDLPALRSAVALNLQNNTRLSKLNMGELKSLEYLAMITLPALAEIDMSPELEIAGYAVYIKDTHLTTLPRINSVYTLFLENTSLEDVQLDIVETLWMEPWAPNVIIRGNETRLNVKLPWLVTVGGTLQVGDCASLFIPVLATVNGSFSIYNATFTSLKAPRLETIEGDLYISGSFTGLASFPSLRTVGGDVFIQSTKFIDCSPFERLEKEGRIAGAFFCSGPPSPSSSTTSATPTAGPTTSNSATTLLGPPVETSSAPTEQTTSTPSTASAMSLARKLGLIIGAIFAALAMFVVGGYPIYQCLKKRQYRQGQDQPDVVMADTSTHDFLEAEAEVRNDPQPQETKTPYPHPRDYLEMPDPSPLSPGTYDNRTVRSPANGYWDITIR